MKGTALMDVLVVHIEGDEGFFVNGKLIDIVWIERLPPLSQLGDEEHYLLHHWLTARGDSECTYSSAWPVWYVVQAIIKGHMLESWEVVRKDLCPRCDHQVLPDKQEAHRYCQELWEETGWTPPGAETPPGEEAAAGEVIEP
jgi:hypothetical protein